MIVKIVRCHGCRKKARVAMTENKAIEELHRIRPYGGIIPQRRAEALDVAIKALEEVQQYRQIGTVEECREAVEKQTAKKPTLIDYKKYTNFVDNADFLQDAYWCPNCKRVVRSGSFCRDCGQRIDWRDEDGKTD
nr:MAG TPA: DNA-directed RNA polymerase II subunit [Caudoviricetes sp.]